jgi:hypothetical protein
VTPSPSGGRSRRPTSVLNRAQGMDDRNGRTPGSTSATSRSRRTDPRAGSSAPRTSDEP